MIVALAQVQMPLMVMPLITALSRIEPNLLDASVALGAGQWRTFRRVILPLTLPGIIAGCLLTYAAAITAFITQTLVGGGQMLFMPMYIYQQSSTLNNWPFAAASRSSSCARCWRRCRCSTLGACRRATPMREAARPAKSSLGR
jgi:putative spermidine/putrescine transport system permease protein